MYDFAISYCADNIKYVQQVVDEIKNKNYNIFFDRYNYDRLVCTFLHEELYNIFTYESKQAILFISNEYLTRAHPMWEARSAVAESVFRPNYLLVVLSDDVDIEKISKALCINRNYLYIRQSEHTPQSLANLLIEKSKNL